MLKSKYEDKSQIPEGAEQFYSEKDGVYVLQAEGVKQADDVEKTMGALEKERKLRRDAEAKVSEFESKYSKLPEDFDIDEFNRLKDSSGGDVDAKLKEQRERLNEQHQKELSKLHEQVNQKEELVNTHVKSATLRQAMAEANIAKPFMPAVEAMMKDQIKVEAGEVFLNEKPVSDALREWASSDDGKYYVSAPKNNGGGSENAQSGSGDSKTIKRSDFDAMGQSERAAVVKEGAKIIN